MQPKDLVPLASSWLNAPGLSVDGDLESEGYDPTQMAYVLEGSGKATLKLDARSDAPRRQSSLRDHRVGR